MVKKPKLNTWSVAGVLKMIAMLGIYLLLDKYIIIIMESNLFEYLNKLSLPYSFRVSLYFLPRCIEIFLFCSVAYFTIGQATWTMMWFIFSLEAAILLWLGGGNVYPDSSLMENIVLYSRELGWLLGLFLFYLSVKITSKLKGNCSAQSEK